MLAFAKHVFLLGEVQPDGATLKEHLEQVAKQTGQVPPELETPEMAGEVAYIWEFYREIGRGRERGHALSCADLDAWQQLNGVVLTPFEVSVIIDIDDVYLEHTRQAMERERRRQQQEAARIRGRA